VAPTKGNGETSRHGKRAALFTRDLFSKARYSYWNILSSVDVRSS